MTDRSQGRGITEDDDYSTPAAASAASEAFGSSSPRRLALTPADENSAYEPLTPSQRLVLSSFSFGSPPRSRAAADSPPNMATLEQRMADLSHHESSSVSAPHNYDGTEGVYYWLWKQQFTKWYLVKYHVTGQTHAVLAVTLPAWFEPFTDAHMRWDEVQARATGINDARSARATEQDKYHDLWQAMDEIYGINSDNDLGVLHGIKQNAGVGAPKRGVETPKAMGNRFYYVWEKVSHLAPQQEATDIFIAALPEAVRNEVKALMTGKAPERAGEAATAKCAVGKVPDRYNIITAAAIADVKYQHYGRRKAQEEAAKQLLGVTSSGAGKKVAADQPLAKLTLKQRQQVEQQFALDNPGFAITAVNARGGGAAGGGDRVPHCHYQVPSRQALGLMTAARCMWARLTPTRSVCDRGEAEVCWRYHRRLWGTQG